MHMTETVEEPVITKRAHVVEEVVPGHAFAHQATLEIWEGDEHGVDVSGGNAFP